jgi:hypothetical protein
MILNDNKVRDLYRGINAFKNVYQATRRTNLGNNEKGDLITDPHKI